MNVIRDNTTKIISRSHYMSPLLAALCTTLLIAGCSHKDTPAELLIKAQADLEKGNKSAAVIELKNALQKDPNLGEARFLLGKASLAQGDPKTAEIELRKAMALKFNADKTIPELARAMLALNQSEQLLLEFEGQKLQSPEASADLLTSIGDAYLLSGKLEKATGAFVEAQTIEPGNIYGAVGEARVLAFKKEFKDAEIKVLAVLEKNPKSVPALLLMGDIERAQGRLDQAIAQYEKATAIEPNNFSAHFVLANAYMAQNKIEGIRTHVAALKKIAPKNPAISYLEALTAYYDKKYKEAKDFIQQSLAVAPDNPQVLLLAGIIEQELNEPAQSEAHLKQAMVKWSHNSFIRKQLAKLYLKRKELAKAEEVLKPALAEDPKDAELLNLAGDIAIAKGDFSEAARRYALAAEINPKNSTAFTQSAIAQLAMGNNAQAMPMLENASKMDQENGRADIALVLAHLGKKEYDLALKAWASLEKKQPDKPVTFNLQAAILIGKNDLPGARKALEHALTLQPGYYPAASNLANLDLRDNKPDMAKQRYRTLLEQDKDNLSALLSLAKLEQATGAAKPTVLALLNQAKKTNPDAARAVLALVTYHLETGDSKAALAEVNEGLIKIPKNLQLLDMAGFTQMQAGEAGQAVTTYSQLVGEYPKQAIWLSRLAQAQIADGKIEAAFQSMTKALNLEPKSVDLQTNAVTAFLRAGKADDGARMLAQVEKMAPKSPALPELHAMLDMTRRDYPAAVVSYKSLFKSASSFTNMAKLHQALKLAGNTAEADSLLNDWLKVHPNDGDAIFYAADGSLGAKDYAKASALYRSILAKQPDNILALNNIAWASLQLKDPKAVEYAQKAYAVAPENAAVLDTLGWILSEQGQGKRGVELLEKAAAKAPQQWDIQLHLAKAQLKDGRKDAARERLKAIIKANANSEIGKESALLLASL